MGIDDAQLAHLLDLARLELTPDAAETIKHDVNRVLAYVDTLSELDIDGVEPLVRPLDAASGFRADEPRPPLRRDDALAVGRADDEGRFVVPRTVDEGN